MRYKKGQSGNLKGRPRDMLKSVKKLTKDELEDIASLVSKSTVEELRQILKDPDSTAIRVMVVRVVIKIIERGDMDSLDKLLNRMIGKVREKVDVTGNGVFPTTVVIDIPDNGRALNGNNSKD